LLPTRCGAIATSRRRAGVPPPSGTKRRS
jgi:hypothetical protein